MIEKPHQTDNYRWLHIKNMTPADREKLVTEHRLTDDMIDYAIDRNESVRMEYDRDADELLLIFDVVTEQHLASGVTTQPIGILLKPAQKTVYTFTHDSSDHIRQAFIQATEEPDALRFILQALYQLVTDYIADIIDVNRRRRAIQAQFGEHKQTSRQLTEMLQLKTRLIYLQNSLANNVTMVTRFRRRFEHANLADVLEIFDDVLVELGQAKTMADLGMDVVDSVSDAYGHFSNQELNWTMKLLTVYSVILTVPTIVGGFYGENVSLPWSNYSWSWLMTLGLTGVLMGVLSLLLWRAGFFRK